jgi:hypothetical protein
MSFLDSVIKIGSSLLGGGKNSGGGSSILGDLAKTAVLMYTTKKANDSLNRANETASGGGSGGSSGGGGSAGSTPSQPDPGVRLQVDPDASHKIPVVYGRAQMGGIITDVEISGDNQVLHVVSTMCERTGIKLSDGLASSISVRRVYINDQRVVFKVNGYTVDYTVDRDGNVDRSMSDLVDIRLWSGGSASTFNIAPIGLSLGSQVNAWSVVPNWTTNHTMTNLVFAVVRLNYNKDKNVNSIPTVRLDLENNMTKPGDVLLDYMTNTRYGAGIPLAEISSA